MCEVALPKEQQGKLLLQSASCYDVAGENFYHGLVLGLCVMLDNRYFVASGGKNFPVWRGVLW